MDKKNNLIEIVSQAYYGNRVGTEIPIERVDRFILGYHHDFPINDAIDRTIVPLPNMDNVVMIYNKYKEEKERKRKEKLLNEKGYVMKPLAVIPELDIELYSRCIVCRQNEKGELESLQNDDYDKFMKYLAE